MRWSCSKGLTRISRLWLAGWVQRSETHPCGDLRPRIVGKLRIDPGADRAPAALRASCSAISTARSPPARLQRPTTMRLSA
jgi:hypothetical protein